MLMRIVNLWFIRSTAIGWLIWVWVVCNVCDSRLSLAVSGYFLLLEMLFLF